MAVVAEIRPGYPDETPLPNETPHPEIAPHEIPVRDPEPRDRPRGFFLSGLSAGNLALFTKRVSLSGGEFL